MTAPRPVTRYCPRAIAIALILAASMSGLGGCPPHPTEIRDWHDLHAVREGLDDSYVLINDLDSATPGYAELAGPAANGGRGWEPIGTSDASFTGDFDGRGYEIRDLYISRPDQDYVGLFGCTSWTRHTGNFGVVGNLGIINADVTGSINVGVLIGHNGGIVSKSYSSGVIDGAERVGGLVGWNQHTLISSFSSCSVSGQIAVGGLAGDNWQRAAVSNSYSTGPVTGVSKVGGLIGWNYYGIVTDCYSTGSVKGSTRLGGLVGGMLGGSVSDSFWDAISSGVNSGEAGTSKVTQEMRSISTFKDTATAGLDEPWDIAAVPTGTTDPSHAWNIVDGHTYPYLSWQLLP
jgi:hypothetical protein